MSERREWTRAEIRALSMEQYADRQDEIHTAMLEGRIRSEGTYSPKASRPMIRPKPGERFEYGEVPRKSFTRREIASMTDEQFERYEGEIHEALRLGQVVDD